MPFGNKHFFYKSESMPRIGEISMSRCMFLATFLPEDKPVHMTMKFPNDLIWSGMYDNSTLFSVKDQFASYADESENTVTNEKVTPEYEKIISTKDSEFTTIDFELKGEVRNLVGYMINVNHDEQGIKKKIQQYENEYGSIPKELSELIENRK